MQMEQESAVPGFWEDQEKARGVMREITKLRGQVEVWQTLSRRLDDGIVLAGMEDEELRPELETEVEA